MSATGHAADAPTNVNSAPHGGIQVGIMPVAALDELTRDGGSLLTAREQEAVSRLKHATRRSESVAGRLVAKWLFVRQVADVADERREITWPPETHSVTPGALDAVPQRDYGGIEILPGDGGAPRLTSCDGTRADTVRISIAHRDGWAAAAVSRSVPIGVDLEVVAPRGPSFYEGCVSDRERQWLSGASPAHTECLATLLWAVKEACFKTGASTATSVWGIGAIDLDIRTPAEQVASSLAAHTSTRMQVLDLDVTVRAAELHPRVAYATRGASTLAVMALIPRE